MKISASKSLHPSLHRRLGTSNASYLQERLSGLQHSESTKLMYKCKSAARFNGTGYAYLVLKSFSKGQGD